MSLSRGAGNLALHTSLCSKYTENSAFVIWCRNNLTKQKIQLFSYLDLILLLKNKQGNYCLLSTCYMLVPMLGIYLFIFMLGI